MRKNDFYEYVIFKIIFRQLIADVKNKRFTFVGQTERCIFYDATSVFFKENDILECTL
jgi:hypothetical protein